MKRQTFMIDSDTVDRLKAIKARSGLSESEQVRRALRFWLQSFGWPIGGEASQLAAHAEDSLAHRAE
jgi:Ribbon-helix-helix protein, copG family